MNQRCYAANVLCHHVVVYSSQVLPFMAAPTTDVVGAVHVGEAHAMH